MLDNVIDIFQVKIQMQLIEMNCCTTGRGRAESMGTQPLSSKLCALVVFSGALDAGIMVTVAQLDLLFWASNHLAKNTRGTCIAVISGIGITIVVRVVLLVIAGVVVVVVGVAISTVAVACGIACSIDMPVNLYGSVVVGTAVPYLAVEKYASSSIRRQKLGNGF